MAGRLVGRRLKEGIALTAASAFGDAEAIAGLYDFADDCVGGVVADDRARWHAQHDILAILARFVVTAAGVAISGFVQGVIAQIHERVEVRVGLDVDRAPRTAVTAGRAALGHKLLAPERHQATPAVAAAYRNDYVVNKFHGRGLSHSRTSNRHPVCCTVDRRSVQT